MLYVLCTEDVVNNLRVNEILFSNIFQRFSTALIINIKIGEKANFNNKVKSISLPNGTWVKVINVYSLSYLFSLLNNKVVAISMLSHEAKDWSVFFLLRITGTPLIYIINSSTIVTINNKYKKGDNRSIKSIIKTLLLRTLPSIVYVILTRIGFLQKLDTVYVSNKLDYLQFKKKKQYKRVVLVNSKSYDYFLEDDKKVYEEKHITFVDSMLPYHQDQVECGFKIIDRKRYYDSLDMLFTQLEVFFNLNVVICAHPQYKMENSETDFGERIVIKGQTDDYIKKSKFVIFHESSAINTAIVYNKNVIQILSGSFNQFINDTCEVWRKSFDFNSVDLDNYSVNKFNKLFNYRDKQEENLRKKFTEDNLISSGEKGVSGHSQIIKDMVTHYKERL